MDPSWTPAGQLRLGVACMQAVRLCNGGLDKTSRSKSWGLLLNPCSVYDQLAFNKAPFTTFASRHGIS